MILIRKTWSFWACLLTMIFLFIGSAVTPPPFVIDDSIFKAAGWMFAIALLGQAQILIREITEMLKAAKSVRLQHDDTVLEITSNEDKD